MSINDLLIFAGIHISVLANAIFRALKIVRYTLEGVRIKKVMLPTVPFPSNITRNCNYSHEIRPPQDQAIRDNSQPCDCTSHSWPISSSPPPLGPAPLHTLSIKPGVPRSQLPVTLQRALLSAPLRPLPRQQLSSLATLLMAPARRLVLLLL